MFHGLTKIPTMNMHSPELRKPPYETDREEVKRLVFMGKSDTDIGAIFGVTNDTIWSRRQRWNLPSGATLKEEQDIDALREMWKAGYQVKEMAELLNMSVQVVYTKLRKHRIRELPRMGIEAPTLPLASLKQGVTPDDEDSAIVITHRQIPKWVMVPLEQYQDLINGTYHSLRESL